MAENCHSLNINASNRAVTRTVRGNCKSQLALFKTERQHELRPVVAFPQTCFKHISVYTESNCRKLNWYFNLLYLYIILFSLFSIILTFYFKFHENRSKSDACLCEILTSKTWEVMSSSNVRKSWIPLYSVPATSRQDEKKCWTQIRANIYIYLFIYLVNLHTFPLDLIPKSGLAFCTRGHLCEYLLDLIYLML
jgi:hypothetical protein